MENNKKKGKIGFSVSEIVNSFRALRRNSDAESGATFMEVLVTIAIIAILMTTVGLALAPFLGNAQVTTAKNNIKTIATAIESYYAQNFEYPAEGEWKAAIDPLIKGGVPKDPWGNEYKYINPGPDENPYGVYSAGKDKSYDTDDDLKSWSEK